MPFGGNAGGRAKELAAMASGKSAPPSKPPAGGGDKERGRLKVAAAHMRKMHAAMQAGDFEEAARHALYMKDV